MSNDDKSSTSSRIGTITAVDNSLKFFALALLIVEAIIGILAVRSDDVTYLIHLSYVATGMFVFVVVMVMVLTIFSPENMLAKKASELNKKVEEKEEEKEKLKDSFTDTVENYEAQGGLNKLLETKPTEESVIIKRPGGPKKL